MKRKTIWYVVAVLLLGLALLAVSCGGGASAPAQEPAAEEPAAEEPAVEEPATPTTGPPAIPHTLEGRDDCLQCHAESAFKPFPTDHSGRTNDGCTTCHKSAE